MRPEEREALIRTRIGHPQRDRAAMLRDGERIGYPRTLLLAFCDVAEDAEWLLTRLDTERAARQAAEADRTALLRAAAAVPSNADDCGVTNPQRERALLELAEIRLGILRVGQKGAEDAD